MTIEEQIIAEKFSELLDRYKHREHFTRAERAVWLLIIIRCEIDCCDFSSVYEQALTRNELYESAGYIREVELPEHAAALEEIVQILDSHNYFSPEGLAQIDTQTLPQEVLDQLTSLGKRITEGDKLWEVDERLLEMLNHES